MDAINAPTPADGRIGGPAPRGSALSCRGWEQEGVLRCLLNTLDPAVAEDSARLVVYGGRGRAARSWAAHDAILAALRRLGDAALDAAVSGWNTAFHACIHRGAGNQRLGRAIGELQDFFPRDSVWRAIANDQAALVAMNVTEHEAIAAALHARRAAAARTAMRQHVSRAGAILLEYLDGQRFWE